MRRNTDREREPLTPELDDLLLDLEELEDDMDDLSALAVHNEQLHRYLREL